MSDDQHPTWGNAPDAPRWQPDEMLAEFPPAQPPAPTWPGWPPPVVEADAAPYTDYAPYAELSQPRMPRVQAVALARQWKRRIAIGSVLTFGLLAALAAAHTSSATTSANSPSGDGANGSGGATTQPAAPIDPRSGGFFGQPGIGSGISPSGSSAPPVAGSHAS
jgi:hypothetical protein